LKNDNASSLIDQYVLVTGANGFLGRHVARLLSRRGKTVLGIGHGDWAPDEWKSWGLNDWYQADISLESLQHYAARPAAIIHCGGGGSVAFSVENPLGDFSRTVVATANVLEYVRLHAPDCRLVYPSSASVYGTAEMIPIPESSRVAPISPYGTHKRMAEQMIASHARQFGTSVAIVRLFSVYGSGLRKQLLWDACLKLSAGDNVFMGTGDEVRDWLQVEDAAELLLVAAERASQECPTVNGGTGEGITVRDVITHLGKCIDENVPGPIFSGAHRTGDPSRYVADIQAAEAWGWRPACPWKQGVEEYARWWKTSAE
jgi:UDP-glucose 4-epimerase